MTGRTRPQVALFVLGGTISGSGAAGRDGRSIPTVAGEELIAPLPEINEIADIDIRPTMKVGSQALTPADVCNLAHQIVACIEAGCDAVVITQGTDTLEETAYALALQLDIAVPIVLTGAMRAPVAVAPDGPGNLLTAFRVATTPAVAAIGPVVVMHDEIHHARWITKEHTSRLAAFTSVGSGPIGSVIEEQVRLYGVPVSSDFLGLPDQIAHRVEIAWTWAGADGFMVDAVSARASGLIVAAMGGGQVPPEMVPSLRRAIERGCSVVLASRCAEGPILTSSYVGPGTATELANIGLVPAGNLSAIKARLRLLVALQFGMEANDVFPVEG